MRSLRKFDYFGRNISILFQNERNHKTPFGGIVTLVLTVGFSVFLYIQFMDSKNPRQLIRNQVHVENARQYDLNQVLNIAFGLQNDSFDHYIDESLYSIEAIHVSFIRNFNPETGERDLKVIQKDVKVEQCREDHFTISQSRDYFRSLNFQGMYCFNKNEELPIEGDFDSERYSYIQLMVKVCQNQSYCKPPSVIRETYKLTNIAMYFTDNVIDLQENDNPFKLKTFDAFVTSGIPLSKDITMFYQNTKVIDKGGLYNEQIAVRQELTYDKLVEMTVPYNEDKGFLYRVTLRHTKSQEVNVVRNFQPWSLFLSQIGGFYYFLLAIGCILCYPVSQIDLNIQLINSLFNIDQSQQDEDLKQIITTIKNETDEQPIEPSNKTSCFFNTCKEKKNRKLQQIPPTSQSVSQFDNLSPPKQYFNKPSNSQNNLNKLGTQAVVDDRDGMTETNLEKAKKNLQKFRKSFTVLGQLGMQNTGATPLAKDIKRLNKQKKLSIIGTGGTIIVNSEQVITKIQNEKDQLKQMNLFKKYFSINSVQFTIWNFIALNLMCCKRYKDKRKQLDKSVSQLYSQLDVHNIMQKLIEVDKLKMLILNENQLKLFEYLPQPKIFSNNQQSQHQSEPRQNQSLENREKDTQFRCSDTSVNKQAANNPKSDKIDILYHNNKSIIKKAEDAWLALNELRRDKKKQTEVDKKLMQMIDPQFFRVFSEFSSNQEVQQGEDSLQNQPISENNNLEITQNSKQNKNSMGLGSPDQIYPPQSNTESPLSIIKLGNEASKKIPKTDKKDLKKSDFYQPDIIPSLNLHTQISKYHSNEFENKVKELNVSDSFYPLRQERVKELDFENDCFSSGTQNDEFQPNNFNYDLRSNQFENNLFTQEGINTNSSYKKQINSTCIQIDWKASKLLSKIKSNPPNSQQNQEIQVQIPQEDINIIPQQEQQNLDNTIRAPSFHLISKVNQPTSPKPPKSEKDVNERDIDVEIKNENQNME